MPDDAITPAEEQYADDAITPAEEQYADDAITPAEEQYADDIEISVATADDWDELYDCLGTAFNEKGEPEVAEAERLSFEPERFLLVRRDGRIVGTSGILTRRMAVPGAVVPTAHVTGVSVAATARRQGILTRMMHRQFGDIRAAGEPIAALWASEGRIYQRFGYGLACRLVRCTADTREVTVTAPIAGKGRLREGTVEQYREAIVALHDEVYPRRPGWSQRKPRHVDYRLVDTPAFRRGAGPLRVVVHEGDRGIDGYALWRVTDDWNGSGPNGDVRIVELCSSSPEAYAALFRFLFTIDLTRTTSFMGTLDEPIASMVNEPRRLDATVTDALWVRLIDPAAALTARRYATDIDIVLDIRDDVIPANSGLFRLTGSPDAARCVAAEESTVDDADLSCDIRALGAAYLGGTSLQSLADAGKITELRPGALRRASVAFGWHRMPGALEVF
jgi:predicted acetyltransferase